MEQLTEDVTVRPRLSRWLLWSAYAVCWTAALIVPIRDQHKWVVTEYQIDLKFLVAKTLHVGCYALFAALTGWIRAPLRVRWLLMFVLMGHATLTEMIQENVPGRSGHLHDVAFDHLGIAIGILLTWKWWRD
jgi:VanZ family protein